MEVFYVKKKELLNQLINIYKNKNKKTKKKKNKNLLTNLLLTNIPLPTTSS
jgi:hypothetical protein